MTGFPPKHGTVAARAPLYYYSCHGNTHTPFSDLCTRTYMYCSSSMYVCVDTYTSRRFYCHMAKFLGHVMSYAFLSRGVFLFNQSYIIQKAMVRSDNDTVTFILKWGCNSCAHFIFLVLVVIQQLL